jgi:nitroreductase
MDVKTAINTKRAVRQFLDKPIPEEDVRAILNAGRRAQSAKNRQPWSFIAIQERGTLEALSQLGNFAGHLAGAALGVAILTPPMEKRFSILFDAGQAAAYMQLAAWEMGIGSCPATIYQPDQARDLLGFPKDLHIYLALSFGYPADPGAITRPATQKGGRKAFDQVVHFDRWGG